MSIVVVNEIPTPNRERKPSPVVSEYRDQIYADLETAYRMGIDKFEFVGYTAKPAYLATLAREEAYKVCYNLVYAPARKYIKRKLQKEYPKEAHIFVPLPDSLSENRIIKISAVTMEDGVKHIFGQIDFKYAKAFKTDPNRIDAARLETSIRWEHVQLEIERNTLRRGVQDE